MKLDELIAKAGEAASVRRVYTEPYVQDGVTLIAAAKVSGGAGGGGGHDPQGQEGEGGGFGVRGRPAGAYVIKDGQVRWMPAVDVNRALALASLVTVVLIISRARVARLRPPRREAATAG